MSKRISFEEANERLHEKIECFDLIKYEGISKPCEIQCRECGKILSFSSVTSAINSMGSYCYSCKRLERLEGYEDFTDKEVQEIMKKLMKCETIGEFVECINDLPFALRGFKDVFSLDALENKIKNSTGMHNTVPLVAMAEFKRGVLQVGISLYTKYFYNLLEDNNAVEDKKVFKIYVNFYEVPSYSSSTVQLIDRKETVMKKNTIAIEQEDLLDKE